MGEDNVHGCLICHAEFADSLQFYEHVMEHADAQSGDDEVDDLPGHDPTPAELPESNEQDGYLAASSEVYSKCPTSPVPLFTPFPANFVGGPSVSTVYQMQPPGNFAARYVAYPQHMSAGIPYQFAYPHVPKCTPSHFPGVPTSTEVSYHNHGAPDYPVCCVDLTLDEVNGQERFTSQTKSIGQQFGDMEKFTTHFKERRIRLGYTQASVGLAMEKHYGIAFSQTTVSRFEAMQLNFHNLAKLKPLFEEWLDYEEKEVTKSQEGRMPFRKRKKRTSFRPQAKLALESHFKHQPTPSSSEYAILADALGLDKEVVRIWFCNRRQKERKVTMKRQSEGSCSSQHCDNDVETDSPDESCNKEPSESYSDDMNQSEVWQDNV